VLDLTRGPLTDAFTWAIGRYDERRPGMYTTPIFGGERDLHVGIDLIAPIGEPVFAFADGIIHRAAYNAATGDYGHTVVTRHVLACGQVLYALHGHLGPDDGHIEGRPIGRGERIGAIGDRHHNGGWHPHLHFQLSWVEPQSADLPGVVRADDRERALRIFPDPRYILGPLY
jgi:murein DD-endopeptidase MepM/ murein hydrolase activator NlpD